MAVSQPASPFRPRSDSPHDGPGRGRTPDGDYQLPLWTERALPEVLEAVYEGEYAVAVAQYAGNRFSITLELASSLGFRDSPDHFVHDIRLLDDDGGEIETWMLCGGLTRCPLGCETTPPRDAGVEHALHAVLDTLVRHADAGQIDVLRDHRGGRYEHMNPGEGGQPRRRIPASRRSFSRVCGASE